MQCLICFYFFNSLITYFKINLISKSLDTITEDGDDPNIFSGGFNAFSSTFTPTLIIP